MIVSYKNKGTKDIAEGANSKGARNLLPVSLHQNARKKLAFIDSIGGIFDLRSAPGGYGWKILTGDRSGQHSIRINNQYRICFNLSGKECEDVEIVDYH